MKRLLTLSLLFLTLLLFAMLGMSKLDFVAAPVALSNPVTSQADVAEALQSAPVMFIENVGQFDEDARFKVLGGTHQMWLASDALWITLLEAADNPQPTDQPIEHGFIEKNDHATTPPIRQSTKGVNLKLSFVNANPQPEIEPFDLLETKMNYFLGNDPDKWRSQVPVWGGVRYKEIYPGIDLELLSQDGQAVQRFVASEGVDLDAVRLRVEGADGYELLTNRTSGETTSLTVKTAIGDVTLPLFTLVAPDGTPLDSNLTPILNDSDIQAPFALNTPRQALPRIGGSELAFSTFIGGSSNDFGYGLALDSAGNVFVTGRTYSTDFPTTPGSYDTTHIAFYDTFVLSLSATGDTLRYSTFIGGSADDYGYGLALDSTGNVFVTGTTNSSNSFPTTPDSYDTTHNGYFDTFVLSLSAAGDTLRYSTFIGGSDRDHGSSLALDSTGNVLIMGNTLSSDFPTTPGSYDTTYNGGSDLVGDIVVLSLSAAGDTLRYSTFIGGSDRDYSDGLALDSAGNVFVTGGTLSSDFPTMPGSYDTILNGTSDAFVLSLSAAGDTLRYSTFIGGSSGDTGNALALDSAGNVIVTGSTSSVDFPTTLGSYDTTLNGSGDTFVLSLSATGDTLRYSTFIGGSSSESGHALALNSAGNVFVMGHTFSSDFPTTSGSYDTTFNGGNYDAFVLSLSAAGDTLHYSTFIGGSDRDDGSSLALDSAGNVFVMGGTPSSDFPTTPGSYDTTYNGEGDVFVLRLDGLVPPPPPTPTRTNTPTSMPTNTPVVPTATATPISPTTNSWTFMLYLAGDTFYIDSGNIHAVLGRAVDRLEQNPNAQVNVVALLDGPQTTDTYRVTFNPDAQYEHLGEKRMDDPATLIEFVEQAQEDFPADHYYLAIADHANGVQGIAWDTTTNPDRTALLTPSEIRQALVTITNNGAQPLDVIHYDGCSFGLLEDVAIGDGLVHYTVASQNIGWSVFAYSYYREAVGSSTTPADLALAIAQRYAERVGEQQLPYTISALDMSRFSDVLTAFNGFGEQLTSFANTNQSNRDLLHDIRTQSQKFDSGGEPSYVINDDDMYVDLVDFAARIKQQVSSAETAADELIEAIMGSQPLVIYSESRSGSLGDIFGNVTWNLDGAFGVSIYYPPRAAGAIYGDYTSGVTFPNFHALTNWHEYLQAGLPPLGPGDPLPEDGPEPLAPLPLDEGHQLYLPVITR